MILHTSVNKLNYKWPLKRKWKNHGYIFYSLKAHAHYFTVFIYLETWRGAKLGFFFSFYLRKLTQMQSKYEITNIYIYSIQIPSWSQTWSHFFVLPAPKKVFCINPWWVFVFDLGISTDKGRVSSPGKSGDLLEDEEK